MKTLFTLTGNLLAETTAVYQSVRGGETHRAVAESFQVGGKGINVAKMAQRLGRAATAVCFPGGRTGDRCVEWLQEQDFAVQVFEQEAETRSGWVVREMEGAETTFLGLDRPMEAEAWAAAIDHLAHALKPGDGLAICGSIPGWRSELADPLGRLLDQIAGKVFVALDTYGPPLADLLHAPINLVKINRAELQGVLPVDWKGEPTERALGRLAGQRRNVRRWVITAGSAEVFGLDESEKLFRLTPPPVDVVSAVGCGDVLLAGILHGIADGYSLKEAVKAALPLAAANAASPGIADFELP